jgi:hypothetical protein
MELLLVPTGGGGGRAASMKLLIFFSIPHVFELYIDDDFYRDELCVRALYK